MMEFILLLILSAGIAAVVMSVFLAIRNFLDRREGFWEKRMPAPEERGILLPEFQPGKKKAKGWTGRMDNSFEEIIRRTGLGWSTQQALGWMVLAGVIAAGALLLWQGDFGIIGLGLLGGMAVPLAIYLFLQARWRKQIRNQLPDVLFLLARSLRAGLSLEQALENVSEHGHQPLAGEIRRAVEQIKLGMTIPAALQGVARRLDLADFDVFVTVVTLHRNLGGNLTLLLDRVASSTRDRNLFQGHFQAATALSRATAICLAAGAPMIFVVYAIWQPDFFERFMQTTQGLRLLLTAGMLEVVGLIWVGLLLRIRY